MAESDVVGGMPPGGLDGGGGGAEPESLSPYEQQLMHLERQLDIESKVKQEFIVFDYKVSAKVSRQSATI